MAKDPPLILWFRKDLRLADNPALDAAIRTGAPVIPVYIHDPAAHGDWAPGGAARWWLHRALESLGAALAERGGRLVLGQGDTGTVLRDLIRRSGATRIYWNRRYEAPLRELDGRLKRDLRADGLEVASFNASLLNEPHTVGTGSGSPYKVFTPYWRNVKERAIPQPVEPDLRRLRFPDSFPKSASLGALGLLPKVRWDKKLESHWKPGEDGGRERLDAFLGEAVEAYEERRNRPDETGTSRLSPYLHWGHVGPRQVAAELRARCDLRSKGPAAFLREIYWREFAYHVLYHFPDTPDAPLRPEFSDFPWKKDGGALRAWQSGNTGYPIVDAGMRELWETGWMHNRVRMIVSSLLVKHLLQHWRDGERWFWDTLVDADLASNTLGWQWSGGCGADAAPYFRIFNPMTQGRKFDPEGAYVRRFVPELAKLDNAHIHAPWEAPENVRDAAGVRLGKDYPHPIIDHKEGRRRALEAFEAVKK